MKSRDTQRAKLYRADDVLSKFAVPLTTVEDVEAFTNKVWASKRVQKAFPKAMWQGEPRVKDGRRTRIARGGHFHISIPRWARHSNVVLHELSHTITQRIYGSNVAGHGWEYCGVFLKLTLYIMGREAHDAFKASMKKHKVRFKPKRRVVKYRPKGFDRTVLIERLKKAREVKAAKAALKPAKPKKVRMWLVSTPEQDGVVHQYKTAEEITPEDHIVQLRPKLVWSD